VMRWLQNYFHRQNLGIKIMAPAEEMEDLNIIRDLHRQLKTAHFGIAEVSNNNLNVLYEAGLLHGMTKPLILLQRSDAKEKVPFDIFSDYRIIYEVSRRGGDIQFVWLEEEMTKAMNAVKKMIPQLDQVPKWQE